ncbi:MAG: phage terminase large subunit [Methanobrevibacter sp.]|nr:phage terminase large subunit [Methanobrevibacter sp.]
MRLTPAQEKAIEVIKSHKQSLLYGGSRSGKTFVYCYCLVYRALTYNKSRHGIFRFTRKDLKESIWLDTFPKVCSLIDDRLKPKLNNQELFAQFPNGSEIWFGYMEDTKRTDNVLGREFNTAYFNEISEMAFASYSKVQTRLSLKAYDDKGNLCPNMWWGDCNPVGKWHWGYKTFIQKVNAKTGEALNSPEQYGYMLMNPTDNIQNLPADYLETLKNLPEEERNRFLLGLWVEGISGGIYTKEMAQAEQDGRIGNVPFNNDFFVWTFWDIGMDDATAIWFVQFVGDEIHLIDYYSNNNQSALHYLEVLKKKQQEYGYRYNKLILPHDAKQREWTNGRSRAETLEQQGFKTEVVKASSIADGINACKLIFEKCWFDKVKCEEGISALSNYHRKENPIAMTYSNEPEHDWTSHGADSFRLMGVSYNERMSETVHQKQDLEEYKRSIAYANIKRTSRVNKGLWG